MSSKKSPWKNNLKSNSLLRLFAMSSDSAGGHSSRGGAMWMRDGVMEFLLLWSCRQTDRQHPGDDGWWRCEYDDMWIKMMVEREMWSSRCVTKAKLTVFADYIPSESAVGRISIRIRCLVVAKLERGFVWKLGNDVLVVQFDCWILNKKHRMELPILSSKIKFHPIPIPKKFWLDVVQI